jgi:molecular chaperone HtpG
LNVSRELLQSQDVLRKIRNSLTNEIIKSLARHAQQDDSTDYMTFLKTYGSFLKEGVYYDQENKEKIAALLRFDTLLGSEKIGIDAYMATADQNKKEIYYLTGQSLDELRSSPYTESFRAAQIDLLLLDEPLDEWVVQALESYKERKLVSAAGANIDIPETKDLASKKKETTKKAAQQKDFLSFVWSTIGTEKLEKVDLTHKLTESVAVLTTPEGQPSAQMEKYMQAMGQELPASKKIFELNAQHPLTDKMIELYATDKENTKLKDLILYSYDQAILLQ